MASFRQKTGLVLTGLFYTLCLSAPLMADDISVFTNGYSGAKPNILLVLDYSGSMNWDVDGVDTSSSGKPSRREILEAAVTTLLDQNVDRINAGVSMFRWGGTGIKWPVADLSAYANTIDSDVPLASGLLSKDIIKNIIGNHNASSSTATVHALAEAALYFRGGPVANGGQNKNDDSRFKPNTWNITDNEYKGGGEFAANPVTYTPADAYKVGSPGTSYCNDYSVSGGTNDCAGKTIVAGSCVYLTGTTTVGEGGWSSDDRNYCQYIYPDNWEGANYISPITDECQTNLVILISDGVPTSRWSYTELTDLLGTGINACEDLSSTIFGSTSETTTHGNCGPEIAGILSSSDQIATVANSTVQTYTIGFNVAGAGQDYLTRIAGDGNGQFFSAEQPADLQVALDSIINDVLSGNEGFAGLSIDVDKANFSNDNRIYFPLFTPSLKRSWAGNLKGYFIDSGGIKDTNGLLATVTDAAGTRFVDASQSFWSPTADGNAVSAGGASDKLASTTRTIYTYTGGSISSSGEALKRVNNKHDLSISNADLTTGLLGIPTDATLREELINWIHSAPMGDPLHSRSVSVRYTGKDVVYMMTNQGLLHAIDATLPAAPTTIDHTGGEEIFAFMPPELLPNINAIKTNTLGGDHIYGLDGSITRWHDDANNDGIVNGTDKVLLIFGMRRGGSNYYALDVTVPEDPKYMWNIQGGSGDFDKMGQSWSRMSLVTVENNGTRERVLLVGGGYDKTMDTASTRLDGSSDVGNRIYMINQDGDRIWEAQHTDMDFSIPSDLNVIDSNSDGIADRIYAGDVGGQVWRIDIGDISDNSNHSVVKMADLGNDLSYEPFFYPPSVALNTGFGSDFISVVLGSGDRTSPLSTSGANRIYMLRDTDINVGAPPVAFTATTTSDLYNASANNVGSTDATIKSTAEAALSAANGWYIDLSAGEKSLSSLVTFEGRIMGTTFSPVGSGVVTACSVASTSGIYYSMSVQDAQPIDPLSDPTDPTKTLVPADRSKLISTNGIPGSPVLVFPKGSDSVQIVVDKQTVDTFDQRLERVLWYKRK